MRNGHGIFSWPLHILTCQKIGRSKYVQIIYKLCAFMYSLQNTCVRQTTMKDQYKKLVAYEKDLNHLDKIYNSKAEINKIKNPFD